LGGRHSVEVHWLCMCLTPWLFLLRILYCFYTSVFFFWHQNTFQTVFPQFLQPVADIDWGPLAQRLTFCQEQEQNSTPAQPPGTLFHPTFMTLLIRAHSENDSIRMYFLITLTTDYCWRSWTSRIARPTNLALIDWLFHITTEIFTAAHRRKQAHRHQTLTHRAEWHQFAFQHFWRSYQQIRVLWNARATSFCDSKCYDGKWRRGGGGRGDENTLHLSAASCLTTKHNVHSSFS